jgi:hypothetical protein
VVGRLLLFGLGLEVREHEVDEFAHALAVLGRDPVGFAECQLVELRRHDLAPHALGLVHREEDRRVRLAQLLRDAPVLRREAGAPVGHEDDDVGFRDRLARLARHLLVDALGVDRLEAAGVDHDEGLLAHAPLAVVAGRA